MEGDGKSFDGSLTDGLLASPTVVLARWRVWSRFRQWTAKQPINMGMVSPRVQLTGPPLEGFGNVVPFVSVFFKCAP